MANLIASLNDRGVKLANPGLVGDCEDVIRQLGLTVDDFVDAAEAASMAGNLPSLTKTAIEGIRQTLAKKFAKGSINSGRLSGPSAGMKTPAPNKFDRSTADKIGGFSASSHALPAQTPAGQMAGSKRPYSEMGSNSSSAAAAGRAGAMPIRAGGSSFTSPPSAGFGSSSRPSGSSSASAAGGAPVTPTAATAEAFMHRKNKGELIDSYVPSSSSGSSASDSNSSSSSAALPDALAASAGKPLHRPSIQTLRALGYRTFKNVSELVRQPQQGKAAAAAVNLSATEPFPLVVSSVTKWAEVTGMRLALPPLPPPPPVVHTAEPASSSSSSASPGGGPAASSPSGSAGGATSPASAASSSAGASPSGGGALDTSTGSAGAGGGGLNNSFGSADGASSSAAAAADGEADQEASGPPDTRRFEIPANRNVEDKYQYMFTTLEARAEALEERLAEVGDAIVAANSLETLLEPVGTVSQSPLVYVGRVVVDGEGKINPTSVLLEGSAADPIPGGIASRNPHMSVGRILLDLREVPSFSLFPGQIVAARGMNTTGEKMVVQALYTAAAPPPPVSPVENVHALADVASSGAEKGGPLRMVVAAGPFTLMADIKFAPLADMLASFMSGKEAAPDVLVLMGPFVDADHPMIKSGGDIFVEQDDAPPVPITYDQIWADLVAPDLEDALMSDALRKTQLVLLPSPADVTSQPVYPIWPQQQHLRAFSPDVRKRVTVLPNPATFVVGGAVVGATSVDVLFALNAEDTMRQPSGPGAVRVDKIPRMASHLLDQRTYYPLFPSSPDVPLEMTQMGGTGMAVSPDLLLLPSKLKAFAKTAPGHPGTLVINPGMLCRGNSGGSYAKVLVFPPTRGTLATQDVPPSAIEMGEVGEGEPTTYAFHSLPQRTKVDIVRV